MSRILEQMFSVVRFTSQEQIVYTDQIFEYGSPNGATYASTGPSRRASWSAGLGSARAGERWRWSPIISAQPAQSAVAPSTDQTELRRIATSASAVRIPETVLRTMREAAFCAGRTESEIWAEAAREWLLRRQRDDEPLPPSPAAAALPTPRLANAWRAIDSLLAELRMSPLREPSTSSAA